MSPVGAKRVILIPEASYRSVKNLPFSKEFGIDTEFFTLFILFPGNSLFVSEAKEIMIYEKSLEKLQIINSTSHASAENQYDLAGHIPRLTFYIIE